MPCVIHLPALYPSEFVSQHTATIAGVPQIVYKLPLIDRKEIGLVGIEIPSFLEEIIIGPTQYPYPIAEALADVLAKAGVENPHQRIRPTNIPLRT